MLKNYLTIAIRILRKNKLYAFVNIAGLSIGIACCLLIGMYIWHEVSYDRFHANADRIARVTWEYNFGDADTKTATTGTKVGPQLQRTFPEVEGYVRTLKYGRVVGYADKLFEEKSFVYADSAFFSMFSFPLLKGNTRTALNAPDKVVLTETTARKYFGNEDPVGKVLKVGMKQLEVTGVAADAPANSQLQFDFIASFTTLSAAKTENYNEANYITYLLLNSADNLAALQNKIDAFAKRVAKEEFKVEGDQFMTFKLEPLTVVHLHSKLDGFEPNNNIIYIYILAVVALLIMLIACVNYTNLSTAQSASRTAEIGIRKVLGARKQQLFNQFIAESIVLTAIALVIAFAAAYLLLPFFNDVAGKQLQAADILNPVVVGGLVVLSMLVAFAAGAYPALVLSSSKVIKILKSGFSFTSGGAGLRKSLIILQFVISIFLITSTIVILKQLDYIQTKDLGYDKEQVIVLPVDEEVKKMMQNLKPALTAHPNVVSVAAAYEAPTHIGWGDALRKQGEDKSITINAIPVDEDFVKTMGMQVIAGSDFTQADVLSFDTTGGPNSKYSYILNEAAAKALGWTPEEAVGKIVAKNREGKVRGVIKDFHFRSFHETINPLLIFLDHRMAQVMLVKVSSENLKATIDHLQTTWKSRISHRPFEYHFLDEEFQEMYKAEQQTGIVFTTFSTLAILLACLGLFALSAFELVKRTKEIGIRKVLGASISDLVRLLTKDFLKLVAIAFVIAVPVSWYLSNEWLHEFTYRINLEWWMFIAAGVCAIAITLITVSYQAIKSSFTNPVKSLRSE
ncbi:ABC transporter permease [Aridibaculum aurantiacum]|uniref:ABC transporter permease n=1 Tax=Aridibaculum aurantiacum TaxID=2810307 RepID=UPI001A97AB29|nr:ABC transporter permease [Aridibaculum aurantiacum]